MAALQCEDLREELREVFEDTVLLGSSEYFTPTRTYCVQDADLPASTSTPYSVSSLYSSTLIQQKDEMIDYFANDAGYFEAEALKDFWSEFHPEIAMDQRGIEDINQEVDDDQMGRPVMDSRKRHKGGVRGFNPIW